MPADLSRLPTYRVLLASSIFFTVFGLTTALAPNLPPASLWSTWIAHHFFAGPMPPSAGTIYPFLLGPLGGTMAAHYTLQTVLVAIPIRRGERWASVAIVVATLVWFAVDSAVSASHGAWFNIWRINLPALGLTCGAVAALHGQARGLDSDA